MPRSTPTPTGASFGLPSPRSRSALIAWLACFFLASAQIATSEAPMEWAKGTKMGFPGLKDEDEREAVIEFLKSHSQ